LSCLSGKKCCKYDDKLICLHIIPCNDDADLNIAQIKNFSFWNFYPAIDYNVGIKKIMPIFPILKDEI
jgi:hypothetical protein